MDRFFTFDARLGIQIPSNNLDWDACTSKTQQRILLHWESIRGYIPDRIKEIEGIINHKQDALNEESDFEKSCQLNSDISELASAINDLWIWYRTSQNMNEKVHN
ncbi:hypothetical protein [Bacillus massiliglaciei]|uniref:hypothetical protein n=1 Tax=Bacillus massiliglaciei TaxID=1816693 RepID=UPI000DA62782|nr:hypothetical protein [Bacillus massiliglaciei]